MRYDSTADDTDEPSAETATVLTDGGSEAADEASDATEPSDADAEQHTSADEDEQQSADDEKTEAGEETTTEADEETAAQQSGDVGVEPDASEDSAEAIRPTSSLDEQRSTDSIIEIRDLVRDLSGEVIGRPLDGIIEVTRNEDTWRAIVEVIERRSVPDTQDILGQYEVEIDDDGEVVGYRRLEKYRRSDTSPSEY